VPGKPPRGWYPRRGEIVLARFPGGKVRPGVILSTDWLNRWALDVCAVPLTTIHRAEFPLRIPIGRGEGGLERDSWAKCDQVHTVEKVSLVLPPLGRLAPSTMGRIEEAVRAALQL